LNITISQSIYYLIYSAITTNHYNVGNLAGNNFIFNKFVIAGSDTLSQRSSIDGSNISGSIK